MEVNHRKEKEKLNFSEKKTNNFSFLDSFGLSFEWNKQLQWNKGHGIGMETIKIRPLQNDVSEHLIAIFVSILFRNTHLSASNGLLCFVLIMK